MEHLDWFNHRWRKHHSSRSQREYICVTDFTVNVCVRWNSACPPQVSDLIIPTMETARQLFFLRTYLAHEIPMLFVGPTGTGKSVINKSFLVMLPKEQYTPNCINFSARTSANQTQDIIMSKLDRRRKGVFGPPMGKKCVVYVGKCRHSQWNGVRVSHIRNYLIISCRYLLYRWSEHAS